MLVPWQLRARLETPHYRTTLRDGVAPERLLPRAGHRPLGPRNVAQHQRLRGRRGANLFGRLDSTGDNREDRRAILACHAMDTPVGTVTEAARRDRARFVADRSLDHIQQLVTDMAMHRQEGTRLEAGELCAPLGRGIRPEDLSLDRGGYGFPCNLGNFDYLRRIRCFG